MNTENRTELPLTDKQRDLEDAIADFIDAHPDCTQDCFETIRTLFRRSAEQPKDSAPMDGEREIDARVEAAKRYRRINGDSRWHAAIEDGFVAGAMWALQQQSECSSPITDEMIAAGAAAIHKPHGWYNSRLGTDVSCPGGNVYVGCNEIAEIRRTAYTVLKAALGTVQANGEP